MSAAALRLAQVLAEDRLDRLRAVESQLAQATPPRPGGAGQAMALAGAYSGGSTVRNALRNWRTSRGDADADLLPDLPELRARSRDLARNAPLGAAAIHTTVINAVGTGLALQCALNADALGITPEQASAWKRATEAEFKLWAEGTDCWCDLSRTQNFYGLQDLALRAVLESGDAIAILPSVARPRAPYKLAVQLIEADRLSTPDGKRADPAIAEGVEVESGTGRALRYHICRTHPGAWNRKTPRVWDAFEAFGATTGRRNVLHLFFRLRPGQNRGVPFLAPVVEQLKQISRYTEAELQAAVISGLFAASVKMDAQGFMEVFGNEDERELYLGKATPAGYGLEGTDGSGKVLRLLPGEELDTSSPGRPNQAFDPFINAIAWQIGAPLGIPAEVLVKKFNSSYSASRAALLDAWRFFFYRRDWLATYFCQPIYEAWLDEAVASGRIKAQGYFTDPRRRQAWRAAKWVGDGPGSLDPEKEVNAAEKRINLEITTKEEECMAYDGGDWEAKHAQRAREVAAQRRDGTAPQSPPTAAAAQPEPTAPEPPANPPPGATP